MLDGLRELEKKYNEKGSKISWRFTEARTHLNSRSILEKYFPELIQKEYFDKSR